MATFSKQTLSGSTNGRPIEILATSSVGTTIHTVQATATTAREMLYLWALNSAWTDHVLSLELGGTATTDRLDMNITQGDGPILVCPGVAFTSTDAIVRGFSTATVGLQVFGYVNRSA